MFATKTSGDLVDHDRSTNSVSQHIHRDKILSAIFYGTLEYMSICVGSDFGTYLQEFLLSQ